MRAAECGHTDCVRLLEEAGASKEVENSVCAIANDVEFLFFTIKIGDFGVSI